MAEHADSWIGYWDSQEAFDPMMRIAAEHFYRRAAGTIGIGPSDVVLDIGCGTGALEDHLVETAAYVYAVDTSPNMIRRCRDRFAGRANIEFHELDPENYTDFSFLPRARVTRIICLSVVQYYREQSDLRRLIESVSLLARPGARLLVADIPTDTNPIADTVDLLRAAIVGQFVPQAMRLLFRSLLSRYRRLRKTTGLLRYPREQLENLIRELPWSARLIAEPLTLSLRRVHLEVSFPAHTEAFV